MLIYDILNFSSYKALLTFDNIVYNVEFNYNTRGDFYTISFYDNNDSLILGSIKLVANFDLLNGYHYLNLPQGRLFLIDPSGNEDKLIKKDIEQNRFKLVYLSEGEEI